MRALGLRVAALGLRIARAALVFLFIGVALRLLAATLVASLLLAALLRVARLVIALLWAIALLTGVLILLIAAGLVGFALILVLLIEIFKRLLDGIHLLVSGLTLLDSSLDSPGFGSSPFSALDGSGGRFLLAGPAALIRLTLIFIALLRILRLALFFHLFLDFSSEVGLPSFDPSVPLDELACALAPSYSDRRPDSACFRFVAAYRRRHSADSADLPGRFARD